MKSSLMLTLSLSLNLLLASIGGYVLWQKGGLPYLVARVSSHFADDSEPNVGSYYSTKVGLFRQLPRESDAIYFVGDSITDYAELQELLRSQRVKNRGISGDTTAGVLARLDEIAAARPAKVFILIGINNLQFGVSAQKTIEEYGEIIDALLVAEPTTHVYLQSVLPIHREKYRQVMLAGGASLIPPSRSQVQTINDFLARRAQADGRLHYIDLFRQLVDASGDLKAVYTDDGLHLNGAGMVAWTSLLQPLVDGAAAAP